MALQVMAAFKRKAQTKGGASDEKKQKNTAVPCAEAWKWVLCEDFSSDKTISLQANAHVVYASMCELFKCRFKGWTITLKHNNTDDLEHLDLSCV